MLSFAKKSSAHLLLIALLNACGSGLCPLKTSTGACISGASSGYTFLGILDTSFGGTGIVTIPVASTTAQGAAMALQPDGKIVLTGHGSGATTDFISARLNTDGSLDTNFNTTGIVTTPVGAASDFSQTVVLQPDGKIVVAGSANVGFFNTAAARYHSNGSLDTNFNTTGTVVSAIGAVSDGIYNLALQPDGKIVGVGSSNAGANRFACVRYNTDGSFDTTFNGNGKVTTVVLGNNDTARRVLLQPDGKVISAGLALTGGNYDYALVRYNTDGSLDTNFNTTGFVTTSSSTTLPFYPSIALQADGKILTTSAIDTGGFVIDLVLYRYNTNGSLDTNFNGTGKVVVDINSASFDSGLSISALSNGKIFVMGSADTQMALLRFNSNGSLDTSYYGTGKILTTANLVGTVAMTMQPDGKALAFGYSGANYIIIRYK
jgi:uncharacterized delta-60 repeat protein